MKNIRIAFIVALLLTGITNAQAQFFETLKDGPLTIGVGWNVVDDDGQAWPLINPSGWSLKPFPSSLKIEKYYQGGFSFVFKGSYNETTPTADDIGSGGQVSTFLSLDFRNLLRLDILFSTLSRSANAREIDDRARRKYHFGKNRIIDWRRRYRRRRG